MGSEYQGSCGGKNVALSESSKVSIRNVVKNNRVQVIIYVAGLNHAVELGISLHTIAGTKGRQPSSYLVDMLHLIRLWVEQEEPTVCNASLRQQAKDYSESKKAGKVPVPFNQQTNPKDHPAFIEWKTKHLPALSESVRKLHADSEKHGAWLAATLEGTRLLHADPVRHGAWLAAMQEGTREGT